MKKALLPKLILALPIIYIGLKNNNGTSATEDSIAIPACNAIYYWRTIFQLDQCEQEFLEKNDIEKIYLRMFDVVSASPQGEQQYSMIKPIATTIFKSPVPEGVAVAPTVYITLRALRYMAGSEQKSAELIAKRVLTMAKANNLGEVKEVQLDCDWTQTTEEIYFAFCGYMRDILREQGVALSSTIRLHQLRGNMPSVDRGTLMLYNTGSVTNTKTKNSILSYNNVEIYAKDVKKLLLPLDFAYPTF